MRLYDLIRCSDLPRLTIHLMHEKTRDNHPFFSHATRRFYVDAVSRHPKFRLIRKMEFGVALCKVPDTFDSYFMAIEASARRNYRKALRLGYTFKRFDFNVHIDDVRDILRSTPIRQGPLPPELRDGLVNPIPDPPTLVSVHDYAHFGVFKKEKLVAYAACLIAGELCHLNDLYGHAAFMEDGVVPMVIIETMKELQRSYPAVRYYGYGTYFGASTTMRRFKRKFLFIPHRVQWVLETSKPGSDLFIYDRYLNAAPAQLPLSIGQTAIVHGPRAIFRHFLLWRRTWGWKESFKMALKAMTQRRIFFGTHHDGRMIQCGWANIGFCRYYPIELDAVVLGSLWTAPDYRGKGIAPAALSRIMLHLYQRGFRHMVIDADRHNLSSQRMIQKLNFQRRLPKAEPISNHDRALI